MPPLVRLSSVATIDRSRRSHRITKRMGLEQLEARSLMAADFSLVSDLTTTPSSSAFIGFFSNSTNVGNDLYFVARDEVHGSKLWKTDGTITGTVLVSDRGDYAYPQLMNEVGGKVVFNGLNTTKSNFDRQLWVSDGTSGGTQPLRSDAGQIIDGDPDVFIKMGSDLYLAADLPDDYQPTEPLGGDLLYIPPTVLWRTDGTSAATRPIAYAGKGIMMEMNGELYYGGVDAATGTELWKTDGTRTGSTLVADITPGGYAYEGGFFAYGGYPSASKRVNGTLFFTASDEFFNRNLWATDGTSAGTRLFIPADSPCSADVAPSDGSDLLMLTDAEHGEELWRTDGTEAGSCRVADIQPGPTGSSIQSPTQLNGKLYFLANDGEHGTELWVSDGTSVGTLPVTNFPDEPALGAQSPQTLDSTRRSTFTTTSKHLYFRADDGVHGMQMWRTDGTVAGTELVSTAPQRVANIIGANHDTVFFNADDGTQDAELWKSDGTAANTQMVADLSSGTASSSINKLTSIGDRVLFLGANPVEPSGLQVTWETDGTSAGTHVSDASIPVGAVAFGDKYLFRRTDEIQGDELWISDGTEAGTKLLKDINPGTNGSTVLNLVVVGATAYFSAQHADFGNELWKTDGTAEGTMLVADTVEGPGGTISKIRTDGQRVFFSYNSDFAVPDLQRKLWVSDGTKDGTKLFSTAGETEFPDLFAARGGLAYYSTITDTSRDIWVTDGSAAGTLKLASGVRDFSSISTMAIESNLLFEFSDKAHGRELWSTDGTVAGTHLMADINPGDLSSHPVPLYNDGHTQYFSAFTPELGFELWRTDGTTAGTQLVTDFVPGPGSGSPGPVTKVNGRLLAVMASAEFGRELWIEQPAAVGPLEQIKDLAAAIRAQELSQDLTNDGLLNLDDLSFLVEERLQLKFGDANVDGVFDSADLMQIMQSGKYEDETADAEWAEGDFDADGMFGTNDLIVAFQRGLYRS